MKFVTALLGTVLAGAALMAAASPLEIKLPPETAAFKPSPLPGYALAQQKCSICHSADYINYQPPGLSLAQWTGEASKMQHAYGAPISDEEVKIIGTYLATTYGSAKADAAAVVASSGIASQPVPAAMPPSNAMALLQGNGCLACHAIDHKVVGPAYRDVAAKYAHDPQAQGKVEASIRNGGSGRWGAVPMPPFSQLSAQDIHTLAGFILHQ
ncbi:c-type cytochrome [Crenobacter sp. SG2305]|uniref:SorB family sulfite dehydrogenase c-type cytochrome subunit n=1 Tax=Crenobacter oryzisoli TaxID=3056844 RepID=UPI0025AA8C97|nr:c-type cytochrome [Crenobacter sp. SG2305]MDN0083788.1 c-type cytochrome [Crenobacter sp. SG2305]